MKFRRPLDILLACFWHALCIFYVLSQFSTEFCKPLWKFHSLGQVKQQVRWCIIFRGALLCNFILKNYLIFPSWRFYFHIRPASDIKFWKQNHGLLFLFFSLNLLFYQLDSPNTKKLKKTETKHILVKLFQKKAKITILFCMKNSKNNNIILDFSF